MHFPWSFTNWTMSHYSNPIFSNVSKTQCKSTQRNNPSLSLFFPSPFLPKYTFITLHFFPISFFPQLFISQDSCAPKIPYTLFSTFWSKLATWVLKEVYYTAINLSHQIKLVYIFDCDPLRYQKSCHNCHQNRKHC